MIPRLGMARKTLPPARLEFVDTPDTSELERAYEKRFRELFESIEQAEMLAEPDLIMLQRLVRLNMIGDDVLNAIRCGQNAGTLLREMTMNSVNADGNALSLLPQTWEIPSSVRKDVTLLLDVTRAELALAKEMGLTPLSRKKLEREQATESDLETFLKSAR